MGVHENSWSQAVGIGASAAGVGAGAAAIKWVTKDGLGALGRVIVGKQTSKETLVVD